MSNDFITKTEAAGLLSGIQKELKEINERLFKDNGKISIQTRLDRHTQCMKVIIWVVGIMSTAIVLNLGEKLFERLAR